MPLWLTKTSINNYCSCFWQTSWRSEQFSLVEFRCCIMKSPTSSVLFFPVIFFRRPFWIFKRTTKELLTHKHAQPIQLSNWTGESNFNWTHQWRARIFRREKLWRTQTVAGKGILQNMRRLSGFLIGCIFIAWNESVICHWDTHLTCSMRCASQLWVCIAMHAECMPALSCTALMSIESAWCLWL